MLRFNTVLKMMCVLLLSLTSGALANAQTQPARVFVSAQHGDDTNATNGNLCSVKMPCRSFNAAIGQVRSGGEVIALDSGGYGPMTIDKSALITAPTGIYAAITAQTAGNNAINVAAGASDTVVIKGLTITGNGGLNGIHVTSVGSLHIEECIISGFANRGVNFISSGKLFITDTIVRNQPSEAGVHIQPATGSATAAIDHSRFENNVNGVAVATGATASISDSVASGNTSVGFLIDQGGKATINHCTVSSNPSVTYGTYGIYLRGANTEAAISDSNLLNNYFAIKVDTGARGGAHNVTITNCNAGVYVDVGEFNADNLHVRSTINAVTATGSGSTVRLASSTITGSARGMYQCCGGVFESLGNNMVRGNTADVAGTITVIAGR